MAHPVGDRGQEPLNQSRLHEVIEGFLDIYARREELVDRSTQHAIRMGLRAPKQVKQDLANHAQLLVIPLKSTERIIGHAAKTEEVLISG